MEIRFNIRKVALITFFVLLTFQILLAIRYKNMGLDESIITFELIVFMGALLVFYSIQKWNDIINPISIYFIFIFGFGYSLLGLSKYIQPFELHTIIIISISILTFAIGSLMDLKIKSPFSKLRFTQRSNILIYYVLIIICLLSFVYEMIHIGYLPAFQMFNFDVYNDANEKLVSFIHYLAMLFSVIPSWTYIFYKRKMVSKKWLIFIIFLSFFVLLNYLSRQTIMLFLISVAITFSFYNRLNYKKTVLYGIAIISVFFIVGQIRMSQISMLKTDKSYTPVMFLNNVAGIEYEAGIVESSFTLYSSIRYDVFNKYVKKVRNEDYIGMGKFIFRPLISITFLDRIGIVQYENEYDVESALATYAINPYLDFGYMGVIIFGLLYGIISSHFYRHYKLHNEKYILSWSIIIFCLLMTPFVNYFSSFFIVIVWGVNKLII